MKKLPGKMFLHSGAILHCLASIFIDSTVFSHDNNSSLWYLLIVLVRMHLGDLICNFVDFICNFLREGI